MAVNLPDPAAAAPVVLADHVVVVPAVPVVPVNPNASNAPVSAQSIFQRCVNGFNCLFAAVGT